MKNWLLNKIIKFIFSISIVFCLPFSVVIAEEDFTQYRTEENKVDGEPYLNPAWVEWNNLPDEEKERWEVVPQKLIYDYVYVKEKNSQSYNGDLLQSYNNNLLNSNSLTTYNSNLVEEVTSILPSYYNLSDLGLVGPVKNQSSLGLCWAFATVGAIESNALITLNKNLVFSERQLDYALAYKKNITEGYNPYEFGRDLGDGAVIGNANHAFISGIAPQLTSVWGDYATDKNTESMKKVLDIDNVSYQVTNIISFPSLNPNTASVEEKEAYYKMLKEHIINYGGIYVGTVSPSGDCYDSNYKIIKKSSCSSDGAHAMLVVGWDDTYGPDYNGDGVGDGAWILKNSWGTLKTYIYLSYESENSTFGGVVSVEEKTWDNNYDFLDLTINNHFQKEDKYYSEFIYYKDSENDEQLNRITLKNWKYFPNGLDLDIYVSTTGNFEDKVFVGEVNILNTGLYSINVDELELKSDKYSIYVESTDSTKFYTANAFTSDVSETSEIKAQSRILGDYFSVNTNSSHEVSEVQLVTNTHNIETGEHVTYKIKNADQEDASNLFAIDNTYVLNDNVSAVMSINQIGFEKGDYTLETYYNDELIDSYDFTVGDRLVESISFKINELNMYIGTTYALETIITPDDVANSNLIWSSDNEEVASVNSEGVITANEPGTTYINVASSDGSNINNKIKIIVSELEGSGTVEDPFLISDKYDLDFIRYNLNSYYKLTNDIIFEDEDFISMGAFYNSGGRWMPISNFEGVLDGNGYTIHNLNISNRNSDLGLFSNVKNARIMNLTFKNIYMYGGIKAYSVGTVTGSSSNSYFENIKILDSEISIRSNINSSVGGIIGLSENDTIINCVNNSEILANANTHNIIKTTGGIVGKIQNNTTIINSYNNGAITSNIVGGLVGQIGSEENPDSGNAVILNSYNTGRVKEVTSIFFSTYSGGISSYIKNSYIKNVYSIANYGEENELYGYLTDYLENSVVENYYGHIDELIPINSTLTNPISFEYISGASSNEGNYSICSEKIFDCENVWEKQGDNKYFTLKQNSIDLNDEFINIRLDENKKVETYFFNELGNYLDIENSNEDVVIITSDGDILPKQVGSSMIKFSSRKGSNITKTFNVTVSGPLVENILLSDSEIELLEGSTKKITTEIQPSNAHIQDLIWASDDESIAIINQEGNIIAIKEGTTTIRVKTTDGSNIEKEILITVLPLRIELASNSIYVIKESTGNKYIDNILLNKFNQQIIPLKYNSFISNFTTSTQKYFELYDKDGVVINNDDTKIKTGMHFKTPNGNYTVVVKGDVNGDGNITITDISKLYSHIRETKLIEEYYYLLSGDSNGDNKVTVTDISKLYSFIRNSDINL